MSKYDDKRAADYQPLDFYKKHAAKKENGASKFSVDGKHYFAIFKAGKIALISQTYVSEAGRDNGIKSVAKNQRLPARYQQHKHAGGKHYYYLLAGNGQDVASSVWYNSGKAAEESVGYVSGTRRAPAKAAPAKRKAPARATAAAAKPAAAKKAAPKKAAPKKTAVKKAASKAKAKNSEDDYRPLAFYTRNVKSKADGIHKFKGADGEYYFAYNDDGKVALISEGYPTQAARDTGAASVLKNVKTESRYKYAKMKNGKHEARLHARNGKEIARSRWFGSAAAAATGVAYLVGTRKRAAGKSKTAAAALTVGAAATRKTAKPKTAAKPKKTAPKPIVKAKAKPKVMKAAPVVAAALGTAALTGAAAAAKPATLKVVAPTPPPAPTPAPKPVAPVTPAPVAAAAAAAAPVVETATGGGLGWLKWLIGALVLLALLFGLSKCMGGDKGAMAAKKAQMEQAAIDAKAAAAAKAADAKAATEAAAAAAKAKADAAAANVSDAAGDMMDTAGDAAAKLKADAATAAAKLKADTEAAAMKAKAEAEAAAARLMAEREARASVASSGALNNCGYSDIAIFSVPTNESPLNITRLGTYPEFGNSHDLTPVQFYEKLRQRWSSNPTDRTYLNYLFRSMGYPGGFEDAHASMFSNAVMAPGTTGLLGLGEQHHYQWAQLNSSDYDRQAFRIESANGQAIHFMKTCGNYFYGCE